ncbi:TPA: PTS sugar transporter subunit IIC [Escherichia coli]
MHEITLLQGLSLAALVFFLGIDFWLEALFLFRPIIVCTLTGAILGDIQTGLITGGLTELAFAGLTPAGGILPAVGFGLLLRVMFKAQYIPYLIADFLFVCYIQVSNLLPVAVLGAGFAVYEFFNAKSRQQAQPQPVASKNEEEDYSNGI